MKHTKRLLALLLSLVLVFALSASAFATEEPTEEVATEATPAPADEAAPMSAAADEGSKLRTASVDWDGIKRGARDAAYLASILSLITVPSIPMLFRDQPQGGDITFGILLLPLLPIGLVLYPFVFLGTFLTLFISMF